MRERRTASSVVRGATEPARASMSEHVRAGSRGLFDVLGTTVRFAPPWCKEGGRADPCLGGPAPRRAGTWEDGVAKVERVSPMRQSAPEEVRRVIVQRRGRGQTLQQLADHLNSYGYPCPQGGTAWRPSSVASVLRTHRRRDAVCAACGQSLEPVREALEQEKRERVARRAARRAEAKR